MIAALRRWLRIAVAAGLVVACSNAGADRVLTVPGSGQVRGLIYLDRNGDGVFLGTPDTVYATARLRLVAAGTIDTIARATSDTGKVFAGSLINFSFVPVPVGVYNLAVDTLSIPHDTMRITRIDSTVTVTPGDTAFVRVAVTYPAATPAQVRTLALKTKVFVVGVALADANVFGDSANSIADPASNAAIRVVKIKPTVVVTTGDSDRILGTIDTLAGRRVLVYQTIFQLGINATTPLTVLTVAQAKTANGGAADAGLVSLPGRVIVLDTARVPGERILHVTDTTGTLIDTLEVRLDSLAGFDSLVLKPDTVGARFHFKGILLPSSTAGRWVLKPRFPTDQF